jgi:hypothetical protein
MGKIKRSKEINDIIKSIEKYIKKHKGNVVFTGSFLAFEGEDCNVVDDIMFAYGDKKTILMDRKEMTKLIGEEKNELINW